MAQLPISEFLTTRLKEYDPKFELRSGTGFELLFFKPLQFILQPFRDEADDIKIAQSFRKILLTDDPDGFDEEAVDALASNLFVFRREGGKASGVARVYYNLALDREYPATGAVFVASNGKTFTNAAPFKITEAEMATQVEDGLYYFDIPVEAEEVGADGQIGIGELITIQNDADAVRVTNKVKFSAGGDRETNTQLIERTRQSIGVRDLVTGKGFRAILFENFSDSLVEVTPIGYGEDEMMRDIVYNIHTGGKVDGYCKTTAIQKGSKDFIGMLIDETRQVFSSSNIKLDGTASSNVGTRNLDRSNGRAPTISEIKPAVPARYVTTKDHSSPIDLSVTQYIRIGVDGVFKDLRIAGVNPAGTTRNEVVNLINNAFGRNIAFPSGNFIRLQSPTKGLTSQIVLTNPTIGSSALMNAFGLSTGGAPYIFNGDGPVTFSEGVHYTVDDNQGTVTRILGATVLTPRTTGESTAASAVFQDATANAFLNIQARDVLTIDSGDDAGDYRVLSKTNNNTLVLDKELTASSGSVSYSIRRTGIKSGEMVYVTYWYNPLSIDIGNLVSLDPPPPRDPITGREILPNARIVKNRGVRPGREDMTITDTAFIRVTSIEIIDAITLEPTGQVLNGRGGYGRGGYGRGTYGIGEGADYYLLVNSPHERFSVFEDSMLIFSNAYEGYSVRVNYEYVPEIITYHNFVRSESERVIDGDILMRHYIPAFVSGEIRYSVDPTNTDIPSNEELQQMVVGFINGTNAGDALDYSDITQLIVRKTDPYDRYTTYVEPFTLVGEIHNTDGTLAMVTGNSRLEVPVLDPFPKDTPRPLSPRIAHWIADNITLVRT